MCILGGKNTRIIRVPRPMLQNRLGPMCQTPGAYAYIP